MKLTSKLVALALALGFTSQAFAAAITPGINTGGSDLVLNAYDPVAGVSFSENLNILFQNFAPTSAAAATSQSWNLGSNAQWNSFLSLSAASDSSYLSDIQYNVVAWQSTNAGNTQIYTTVPTGTTAAALQALKNAQLYTAVKNVNSFPQSLLGSTQVSADQGSTVDVQSGPTDGAYFGVGFNAKWSGQLPVTSVGNLGQSTQFDEILASSSSGLSKVNVTQFATATGADTWNLSDGGLLTYTAPAAAVPEPESYALIGLGLFAAVLARRSKKSI